MPFPPELPVPTYAKGTMPVGTPVKQFAPYKAPSFTNPAVAVGQVVTSVTLQSTSAADQTNVPFTFGHAFKKGDFGPDCTLVGAIAGMPDLPLQVNVKATHNDGSVRHAIISGLLPSLPAGASVVLGLKRVAAATAGASVAQPSLMPSIKLNIAGAAFTAMPKSTDAPVVWFTGPLASDYIYNLPFVDAAGNAHPTLTAQFSVRAYSTGAVRVDAVVEHCKAYHAIADVTYDVSVFGNSDAAVYSRSGLVHFPAARWKKSFWYGSAPAVHIRHDTPYLIGSKQVPNYDQSVVIKESLLADYAAQLATDKFEPMQFGTYSAYMGNTGGRPELGIMPDSYAATVLCMDKRAKDMMLASACIGGSWYAHFRDDGTGPGAGLPLDTIHYPCATILGNGTDSSNQATGKAEKLPNVTSTTPGSSDTSHQAAFGYLPYLLTGDYYFLEELLFWANFNNILSNPGYRQYSKSLVSWDQVRGAGWTLRTMAEAAAITPDDHPQKQYFAYWYECNMAWHNAVYTDGPSPVETEVKYFNQLGIITNGFALGYKVNGQDNTGIAPWMDDHFTSSLGHGYELLEYESAGRLLNWKAKFQIGRLVAPGVCYIDSAIYALGVRPNGDWKTPFFTTLSDCYKFTLPSAWSSAACDSEERRVAMRAGGSGVQQAGEMTGYPYGTEGFPSNLQPALAMAVDTGYEGGSTAWSLFSNRSVKPDYGIGPQFAIVPRVTTPAPPAPPAPPTPTPDHTPAPVPTPDPVPAPKPDPVPASTPAPSQVPVPLPVPSPPIFSVRYQEVQLSDVMTNYAVSALVQTGEKLSESEWFFDAAKGIVVFKTTTTK